jgi:hypothetical protein
MATVRRYLKDGRVPSVQPGGARCRVLIPVAAVEHFLCTSTDTNDSVGTPAADAPGECNTFDHDERRHGPEPHWTRRR